MEPEKDPVIQEERPGHSISPSEIEGYLKDYLPFARKKAGLFSGTDVHLRDDLVQEGLIGLYKGLAFYDPCRGELQGFAKTCIVNAMLSFLRKLGRPQRIEEKLRNLGIPSFVSPSVENYLDDVERLQALLQVLSPMETAVLDALGVTGGPKEAALLLEWPLKKVENAFQRIRKKAEKLEEAWTEMV